jgi:thiosulfate/3-mercaptopyruvate sulfurtransferase
MLLYESGHIPGAVKIDWVPISRDPLIRDYIDDRRGSFPYAERH